MPKKTQHMRGIILSIKHTNELVFENYVIWIIEDVSTYTGVILDVTQL